MPGWPQRNASADKRFCCFFRIPGKGTADDLAESSLTDKELRNQFKTIEKLPKADKNVVKVSLDAFITKN
jgi:hypothetical protein